MSGLKIRKSTIVVILILLFPIFNLIDSSLLGYYDEVIGLAGIISAFYCLASRNFSELDKRIFVLLAVITLMGVVSNFVYNLANSNFGVLIDILHLWKTFGAYFLFKYALNDFGNKQRAISILSALARVILVFMFAGSLIGQVINIGVCGNHTIFGIFKEFNFFWHNGIQTGWLIFGCILTLVFSSISKRSFYRYYICSLIPMLLTGSMLVYSFAVIETALLLLWRGERLKITYLLLIGLVVIIIAWQDIVSYFLNIGVRMQFYIVAIGLASKCFPLGTGFATFGSEMAARYYSDVYISLGWQETWVFGTESHFLNDNFFASILGQFGFIGLFLYLVCLYYIFKSIILDKYVNKIQRITLISVFLTIVVVMLGSASVKSMMGIFIFSLLGFFLGNPAYEETKCNAVKTVVNQKLLRQVEVFK